MVKKAFIELKQINLGYKTAKGYLRVIENASLQFFPGELIGLVGINGSGKSTLLKSISGALVPLSGEIFIDGVNILNIPLNELAKKISIVLTDKIRGFNLKTKDLISSGQMPYTNSFHQLEKKHLDVINQAIALTKLEEHQHKNLNELSDGLFQKAIIAKALAQQTPGLLLDEPTAYLDYGSKHKLFLLLKELCEQQSKCILVSSHDLDLLVKYCTKILVVSGNALELLEVGAAKNSPAFNAIGGGYL